LPLGAEEIDNERPDRLLTPEFAPVELPVA
jgi:hypothetical protein